MVDGRRTAAFLRDGINALNMNMNRFRFALASLTLLLLLASLVLSGPALAAFSGRNGRIAWAVLNAGGGGGGGFASLTSYPADLSGHGMQIGYCSEDDSGNVCGAWQNVTYSPDTPATRTPS